MIRLAPLFFPLLFLLMATSGHLHAQNSGVRFIANRGQIIDMEGRRRPDILFMADAA